MGPGPGSTAPTDCDAIVVGAGLAGLVATKQLLDRGLRVVLVEKGGEDAVGGLALHAFGGMLLVDTPLQRRAGIRDSADLAWSDWLGFAQFDDDDLWPRRWAERYIERCIPDVYEWLRALDVRFIPAVQWVERGWMRPGNSLPRYHVMWGTARYMTHRLLLALQRHAYAERLRMLLRHRVEAIVREGGSVCGCRGRREDDGSEFLLRAGAVVISGGGITGDLARVRRHWPHDWGPAPRVLLNGSHPAADGRLHDAVRDAGGRLTHLDRMWNYAAGVRHPNPQFEGQGLSLIPARTAIWTDPDGHRIGPVPFVTAFDTLHMVRHIARAQWPHTWQVLNRRIAQRELAASGAEHNPLIRDRRMLRFALQMLRGNSPLVDELLAKCSDFVQAPDLATLAGRMNALAGDARVTPQALEASIRPYDEQMRRGARFHNDDQLRRIAQLRAWPGDRVRTCKFQPILDPEAGPLIAIRCQLLTRKSTGGIQTDLHSRVLGEDGAPLRGLYAAGEAAGFGGGGCNGRGSLEGTFLSGCILTAQAAASHIAAAAA